jgi:hypothetical protein
MASKRATATLKPPRAARQVASSGGLKFRIKHDIVGPWSNGDKHSPKTLGPYHLDQEIPATGFGFGDEDRVVNVRRLVKLKAIEPIAISSEALLDRLPDEPTPDEEAAMDEFRPGLDPSVPPVDPERRTVPIE